MFSSMISLKIQMISTAAEIVEMMIIKGYNEVVSGLGLNFESVMYLLVIGKCKLFSRVWRAVIARASKMKEEPERERWRINCHSCITFFHISNSKEKDVATGRLGMSARLFHRNFIRVAG